MTNELYCKKYTFIKNLEMVLFLDRDRSGLEGIDYIYDKPTGGEWITVSFIGGRSIRLSATANSNGANAKAIINAVYNDF